MDGWRAAPARPHRAGGTSILGRPIAALHLETTRVVGGITMIYLTWALWGSPPAVVRYVVLALLAFAAAVELRAALRLPVSRAERTS